ncbi:lytic murein transglycosylase B [Thiorhodovibrio frisius]|uniref:Lytic murein transglycosylase B n=1 Tax=Thiorhodovibrio frisius TaxID=631362 RepID=H8Z0T2_9GAMM|nr:lytic murein transglycosylase B [Thiorhodovibrio frisius]EIC21314.1 lytic murein transglycosylase B [Thiorhodovibrio frisius]WPL23897.1 Membrane-bound lytic murein transglycosylase B precursor [Thiorhodovibrio frisius]
MTNLQARFLLPLACAAVALSGCSTQQTRASDTTDGEAVGFAAGAGQPSSVQSSSAQSSSAQSPHARSTSNSDVRLVASARNSRGADGFVTTRSDMGGAAVRAASLRKVSAAASVQGDYAGDPGLERFMVRMQAEGFDAAELARLFSQVERQQWIIDYMHKTAPRPSKPSRPTGAWLRYRNKFLKESNIAAGTDFWRRHASTLASAEKQYGVPAEYLVAIIGVETRWGGYLGSHRVIDALSTLAFDYPRRSEFFTDELAHYLIIARDEQFDPLQPVGSFAGAMGLGQFMPSSFRRYAVDFDGNGHRNLWDTEDAIGSVANYFIGHGWRPGQPVARRVSVAKAVPASLETGFPSNYRPAELTALGIDAARLPAGQQRLSLLQLDVGSGYEYWVGFDNFYAITRYNHSTYYAMAVHQLAQALKARQGGAPRTLITEEVPASAARG